MTDREALLRAVAATPDDDTPRLIYADCLDEIGGEANVARARFIRLQIELARETNTSWFARADRLSESARLASRHAVTWLNELPKWAADEVRRHPIGAEDFSRGFVEAIRVHPVTFRKQGDQLLDIAPIRKIEVSIPPISKTISMFLSCQLLTRLRGLCLHADDSGNLVSTHIQSARTLWAIEELDLSGCGLTDTGAILLATALDLRQLRVLRVARNRLTTTGVSALLTSSKLPNLHEIEIRSNPELYGSYFWLQEQYPGKCIIL
jgi:uncharacterized protein (TIGR02996 family)